MKISEKQHEALDKLLRITEMSSYELRVGMNTLNSLEAKGLIKSRRGVGSMAFPHTSIKWSITNAGRAVLGSLFNPSK
jgi:DNA-binding IscR family transcriptional regulator